MRRSDHNPHHASPGADLSTVSTIACEAKPRTDDTFMCQVGADCTPEEPLSCTQVLGHRWIAVLNTPSRPARPAIVGACHTLPPACDGCTPHTAEPAGECADCKTCLLGLTSRSPDAVADKREHHAACHKRSVICSCLSHLLQPSRTRPAPYLLVMRYLLHASASASAPPPTLQAINRQSYPLAEPQLLNAPSGKGRRYLPRHVGSAQAKTWFHCSTNPACLPNISP